ncbi:MAG: putative two-component sensor histidine kinase [Anaerolineaceae bacterium]|nr:MAG: putative two-component sensor histidine kinase [Anaerolineaceae bacterium]
MRTSDSPFVADWFAVSLRWLALLGLTISIARGGDLTAAPGLVLGVLAVWNLVLTVLAGLNRRLSHHREISLAIDLAAAAVYFFLQRGFFGPAAWIVFVPLFSASLYFEMRGALIAAVLLAAVQAGVTVSQTRESKALLFAGGAILLTFGLAALFGFLSQRVVADIRRMRRLQQEDEQRRLRMENERVRAVYSLTSTLMTTLNYKRVIDSALDISLAAMNPGPDAPPDDLLVCAGLLFSKEEILEVGSARRFTPADMRAVLAGREGIIARSIDEDKPLLADSVRDDPELSRIAALLACGQVYCFPLRSGFSAYGVLLFGHPEPGYFTPDRRELLEILGRQALIAIQNARLYQDLVEERDRMIEVQEEARKKMARDLHDGPTQSVAAMAMRVNLARRVLEKDPKAAGEELVRIEELARRTSKEIRHMLFTLRPLVLESQGLIAALHAIADKTKETYSQEVLVQVDEMLLKDMEIGKQSVIFFIAEEAVNNARKHARAVHIGITLRSLGQGIAMLEIVDDGVGFDVEAVNRAYDKRGSLGMINLRERAELISGLLNIQSAPGKGTRVQVYIPLTEEAADRLHHSAQPR